MCGGKIFKPNWVGLSVGKVRSVCVKLQRNCLPFFGRLLVVGSVVLRLLVTVSGLAKVAIFTTNVDAENQTLINHKCVCGALNRHFCQTRVRRSAIFPPNSELHFFLLLKVVLKCPKLVRYIFCLWFCSLVKINLKFLSTSLQFQ